MMKEARRQVSLLASLDRSSRGIFLVRLCDIRTISGVGTCKKAAQISPRLVRRRSEIIEKVGAHTFCPVRMHHILVDTPDMMEFHRRRDFGPSRFDHLQFGKRATCIMVEAQRSRKRKISAEYHLAFRIRSSTT